MKNLILLLFLLTGCSSIAYRWMDKHPDKVVDLYCRPDTLLPTVTDIQYVPVIQIDTAALRLANESDHKAEVLKNMLESSYNNMDSLHSIIEQYKAENENIRVQNRQLLSNTTIKVITKREPYPVYRDNQATIKENYALKAKNANKNKWLWGMGISLSVILIAVIFYILLKIKL